MSFNSVLLNGLKISNVYNSCLVLKITTEAFHIFYQLHESSFILQWFEFKREENNFSPDICTTLR